MKITVCNGKGGIGKTTVTLTLSLAFAQTSHKVGLIDCDSQGTLSKIAENIDGVEIIKPDTSYDVILIDTPPRPPKEAAMVVASVQESDITVLVSSPYPVDLWTTLDTAKLIQSYSKRKDDVMVLFNKVRPNTIWGRELDQIKEKIGLPVLKSMMSLRECYSRVALLGWKALDKEAREEVIKVALELTRMK
jgi:chromosome partitioning protein